LTRIIPVTTRLLKKRVELLGEDIKYIKTHPVKLKASKKNLIARPIFHLFTWTPLLLAFFIPFIYKKRKEANKDQLKLKRKQAHKVAAKRLIVARKLSRRHLTTRLFTTKL
jgi:hypothetical protein